MWESEPNRNLEFIPGHAGAAGEPGKVAIKHPHPPTREMFPGDAFRGISVPTQVQYRTPTTLQGSWHTGFDLERIPGHWASIVSRI